MRKVIVYVKRICLLLFLLVIAGVDSKDIEAAEVHKVLLIDHNELEIDREEVVHLPGLGLGIYNSSDSIRLLDDPELRCISLREPIQCRSFVMAGGNLYAAAGDSIFRVATDSLPRKFVGRFDNEQFTLSRAGEESFFVCTADDEFSCVYEVFPETGECEPVIGVDGPIYKIENNGVVTMLWARYIIYTLGDDFMMRPVYQHPEIYDAVMSGIGLMVATSDGLIWIPGSTAEATLVKEPVIGVWWDDSDVLYYLTGTGDLIAVSGLLEQYQEAMEN